MDIKISGVLGKKTESVRHFEEAFYEHKGLVEEKNHPWFQRSLGANEYSVYSWIADLARSFF